MISAEDGTQCVIMELLEGADFAVVLTERQRNDMPFSIEEITDIFAPIVMTLDAAHARAIVHRDIKPSNIFLPNSGFRNARIMDFGLAKAGDLSSITADRILAGSPSYIAPEVWKNGAKEADSRSDIYSLAVVLFEALTFGVPIQRNSLVEMLVAVTTPVNIPSIHDQRPSLPEPIDDWAAQALATNPDDRFQTIVAMWRAFRYALNG
jgi:serine/threonine-protein kinase